MRWRNGTSGDPRVRSGMRLVSRVGILAAVFALLTSSTVLASGLPTARPSAPALAAVSPKMRGDLPGLVAGTIPLDRRIPGLVPGYQPGELAVFAILSEPAGPANLAALTASGARILRSYRSTDMVALAVTPAQVGAVAALSWVTWLVPVEVVVPLSTAGPTTTGGAPTPGDAPALPDQTRTTAGDLGAPELWNAGITGSGVTIAVLDTGLDASHQDLDDLDFGHWSLLPGTAKVVEARDFNGGQCSPVDTGDRNGHGTHVAGIAAGTGEGGPTAADDGGVVGIAPDARLAIGKVFTDAGAGLNSDLIAAMEWAAMPADRAGCSIGAQVVNMSLGSEARPTRLNTDADVDVVGQTLDRLAVRYGTLFVVSAGNSGPFVGSVLEAPGAAAQALSVAATAKDWDVNHDDTQSGDTCAGWRHPSSPSGATNDCGGGTGDQPSSISSFSSRGPSGDLWLRPDVAAPGYNIVSAQAATGAVLAQNDLNRGTRGDPLYTTATGTSMAAPATGGAAALLLDGYRQRYGTSPSGGSGLAGLRAPAASLVRAALMNTARGDLYESRWILTVDAATRLTCPTEPTDPSGLCAFAAEIGNIIVGSLGSITLDEVRNGATDPYAGPLSEGAGKIRPVLALAALRDGVVIYSAAAGAGVMAGTGHRDLQGSWQVGAIGAGTKLAQRFVVHAAPGALKTTVRFSFLGGNPSDGTRAIPTAGTGAWTIGLPGPTKVAPGGDAVITLNVSVPSSAPAGSYSGVVLATTDRGQVLRIPVFASVALHDTSTAAGNTPGPQARITSAHDVFAKGDTTWPSVVGTPGTGSSADWLVYPVNLASGLTSARFSVWDSDRGDETYDLYLYDAGFGLIAHTHPFAADGVTDIQANNARGPTTQAAPGVLSLTAPAGGRYYVVVSRARVGGTSVGDFGSFALTLDEVKTGR